MQATINLSRTAKQATPLKLGPIEITSGVRSLSRMAILIWGPAGVGKTTLAATAPGDKLWLSFGDNEHGPVSHRTDVRVADFSGMGYRELCELGQSSDPFKLDSYLAHDDSIASVIVDSSTALIYKALQQSVSKGIGGSRQFTPTMEFPGRSAYGGRNAITLEILTEILKVTAKYNVHCIVTAHEDDPTTTDAGDVIEYIGIMLGGKIVNNMSLRFSEIWYYGQEITGEKARYIAFRPTRKRRPMKTRMFTDKGPPEFYVDYDADLPDAGQMTIASFYEAWVNGGGKKLPVPTSRPIGKKLPVPHTGQGVKQTKRTAAPVKHERKDHGR